MTSRREFIKSFGRYVLLALMAILAAWGIWHNKIAAQASPACATNPSCVGCAKLAGCTKSQAAEFKNEKKQVESQ